MFRGFWTNNHQSFSQCLNLSPAFKANPAVTKFGGDASVMNGESQQESDDNVDDTSELSRDENEEETSNSNSRRRKSF
jgi:hypothetical protein